MRTELVLIIDRSGSMATIWTEAKGGFKKLIQDQKSWKESCCRCGGEHKPRTYLTLVAFDTEYDMVYKQRDIFSVPEDMPETVFPRGMTALNDAIGKTISEIENRAIGCGPNEEIKRVVAIVTDGLENSSREWDGPDVKKLIERKQREGWEFMFLGTNQDAIGTAISYGIPKNHAVSYQYSGEGSRSTYFGISHAMNTVRGGGTVASSGFQEHVVQGDSSDSDTPYSPEDDDGGQ